MASPLTLAGGLALGLASTLHCAGMCGGVAAMTLAVPGRSPSVAPARIVRAECRSVLQGVAAVHLGRITSYAMLGAAAGGFGTLAVSGLDPALGHRLLRWAASASLLWIGLSIAGLVPGPVWLARFVPLGLRGAGPPPLRSFIAGLGWGLLPCGMVYGALLYALFTGSALTGALVMAGFGIGTLPGLAGATFGAMGLRVASRRPAIRSATGWAIAMAGMASLLDPERALSALCRTLQL